MGTSGQSSGHVANLIQTHAGQQLHVSGVFIVVLELALVVENLLPILLVMTWLPAPAREVSDKLVAAFSATCIISALVPTPLGLASYFSGGWYGGTPTCITYQVTSIWCNLFSLALLTYICVNSHFVVWDLMKLKSSVRCLPCQRATCIPAPIVSHSVPACSVNTTLSPKFPTSQSSSSSYQVSSQTSELTGIVSVSAQQPSSPYTRCENNANTNVVSVFSNEANPQVETEGKHAECDNTVYTGKKQDTGAPLEKGEIKYEDDSQRNMHCHNGLMSVSIPQKVTDLKFCTGSNNDTLLQYKLQLRSSQASQCILSNDTKTDSNNHYVSPLPDSQSNEQNGADHFNKKTIKENTLTRSDIKYSQVTPTETCDKLEIDSKQAQHYYGNTVGPGSFKGSSSLPLFPSRDFVSVTLLALFACTLLISCLPVVGLGPRTTHTETSCRSWFVPLPLSTKEKTFYVVHLLFVYICMLLGCCSGISVCLKVSKRMKQERKRKSRLYHEEENIPDVVELFTLNDMKKQYSLTCVIMAGLLTWMPVMTMLTLQKAGVQVSEATIMYSSIATSLPGLLNPLLYSLALTRYRIGYKAVMEKCCSRKRPHRAHQWEGIYTNTSTTEVPISADTVLKASPEGHTCLHGRVNPNFDSHLDISADDSDDENDEDYFPEDNELTEDDKTQPTLKPSEKTPLQAMPGKAPSAGDLRTVLANRIKPNWQHQQDAFFSSCSDKELLLVSMPDLAHEETGL